MSNITQIVNTDKNMKTLKKGIHYSDLDQLLSSSGPFTLFAPSDLAFEKEGNSYMDDMLTSDKKSQLAELLNNHIVDGQINFQDLKDGDKLKTVNGKTLSVEVKNGIVHVEGTTLMIRQQRISNGVIHGTDKLFI